ncbi:hypothetical protein AX16_002193 [Volvariella volvacea WC 439]|nr:hypothetical protein AX16_002193 [Volvariella volvacea WC 439]
MYVDIRDEKEYISTESDTANAIRYSRWRSSSYKAEKNNSFNAPSFAGGTYQQMNDGNNYAAPDQYGRMNPPYHDVQGQTVPSPYQVVVSPPQTTPHNPHVGSGTVNPNLLHAHPMQTQVGQGVYYGQGSPPFDMGPMSVAAQEAYPAYPNAGQPYNAQFITPPPSPTSSSSGYSPNPEYGDASGNTFRDNVGSPAMTEAARRRRSSGSVAQFVCDSCGKDFTAKHNLKHHMNAHNNLKVPCPNCRSNPGPNEGVAN